MSMQALAAELVLDRTTLGRNLTPLEREGLVESTVVKGDKRVRLVAVTPAGIILLRKAAPAWNAAQQSFEAQYGVDSAAALRQDLQRLTAALGAET